MGKTIVMTGTAMVSFRKVIEDLDDDEFDEIMADQDRQESQIDEDDLRDIEFINDIKLEIRP